MKNTYDKSEMKSILRQKAEELLKIQKKASGSFTNHENHVSASINPATHEPINPIDADTLKFIHELEVHQIELEMVNDELILAKDQAAELATEKYVELYNFAPTGYFTLSKEGEIIELNLSGSQMLGRERSRLINRRIDIFISEDTKPNFNLFLQKIFSGKTKETCEATISTNGNLPMFVYLTGIVTQNGEQCFVNMVDITRSKQAEALEQTRQNYETFFNAIDEFRFVLDEQGNIIHINSKVADRLGYAREELFGKSVLMVHSHERREEAGRILGEMLSGVTEFCPIPIVTKSGIQIPVETRVSRGFWDGKPVIFGVTKDISQVRLSEEKFSKVFYLNPSACGLSDLDNRTYVEVNEAFYTLLGFDKNEVIGKTASDLGILTPESIKTIEAKVDENGKANNIETKLRAKNGDIKHVMLSADNIYIQDKKYRFTVVHDITERKHDEDALRDSEEKHRNLFDGASDAIFIHDAESPVMLAVNMQACDRLGYTNAELMAMPTSGVDTAEQSQYMPERVARLMEQGHLVFETVHQRKNGSVVPTEVSARRIIWDGKPVIMSICRDITERKQAEQALKEISTRLTLATRAGGVGVWDMDIVNNSLFWDDQMFVLYGVAKENFGGEYEAWRAGVHPEDVAQCDAELQMAIRGEKEFDTEFRVVWPNGTIHNIRARAIVERDESGKPFHVIGTNWDVTAQKRLEEALRDSRHKLQKINDEKDKFFSIIAHDLRSPFNGILGLSQILVEDLPGMTFDETHRIAVSLRNSATKLFRLLENLLEWARIQQGLIPFNPELVQLLPMVNESIAIALELAKIKGIDITCNIPDDLMVFTDRNILQTVIRNLVSNAVKFTPKGGKIWLFSKATDDKNILFSIKDSGIGMSPEMVDNLFRLDLQTNRKGTEGEPTTGLGLIICKDFIEKHGGKIFAESEVGKGSTFFFTLPVKNEQLPVDGI
ncbi:MAG: PAS domain S-box protein [Bacteroidetes bacterium]|nr:PAS domain S-box protein [Bacteroidota bacterium]